MDAAIAATIAFLLLLMMRTSTAGTSLGKSLFTNGTPWLSPSGRFAFGFYQRGSGFFVGIRLVGERGDIVVWTANRDDPPVTSNANIQFTGDGKLILTEKGQEKLIAKSNGTGFFASMRDTGNFVIYNSNADIIWQSFDHPTDTLLGGQSLSSGGQLFSKSSGANPSTGRFRLKMQDDGNLVLYPKNTADTKRDAYWEAGTDIPSGSTKNYLYLKSTGSLLIRNSSDLNIYSLGSYSDDKVNDWNQAIYRATLDIDGVLRLYGHVNDGSVKKLDQWPGGDTCEVKGFCGFNSYCTFNDDQPECHCLDGFEFKDANEETLGCTRSSSKAECTSEKDSSPHYNMASINNIELEDRPYFKAEMSQGEECSSACLADRNCWVALRTENSCQKHGLPLRYVKRTGLSESYQSHSTIFLKVGNNSLKPESAKPPRNKAAVYVIISVFTLFLCSMIAISSHYMYKIRLLSYKRLSETSNLGLNEEVTLRRFSYNELKRATNHFREELGKGSFGAVYKGALYKGRRLIAVKRLEKLVEEGEREFQAEVRAIGKTHHRNLVRLLGFCAEGSKRLLVYEYMSNGSLGQLIFGDQRRPDWEERVRIALNIARGILYLHEGCEAPIIHCDLKPQNILMDEFWTAKISDFGLAKLLMPDQTRTFTGARGTRGYMAPEWNKNIPISVKADVYSYGIVLLETLCCRKNIDVNVSEPEEVLLSGWAYKCFVAEELNKLVPLEAIDKNVLENMVKVALWCIQDEPVLRPAMKSVVLMLEGITDIAIPPCPNPSSM